MLFKISGLFYMIPLSLFLYYFIESFCHQHQLMVFHWTLSDSKSSLVSRTLLSILADLNNAAVWGVSPCPLISKSTSSFTNSFRNCIECTNYTSYHRHLRVSMVCLLISLYAFFQFYVVV